MVGIGFLSLFLAGCLPVRAPQGALPVDAAGGAAVDHDKTADKGRWRRWPLGDDPRVGNGETEDSSPNAPPAEHPTERSQAVDQPEGAAATSEVAKLLQATVTAQRPDGTSYQRNVDGWRLAIGSSRPHPEGYRFRHAPLEELLARPEEKRPDLQPGLTAAEPVIVATAAIGLLRQKNAAGIEPVVAAIRQPSLSLPVRQAAAETLARSKLVEAAPALIELLDQYGDFAGPRQAAYSAELHAELLPGLAALADEKQQAARLSAALASPADQVRSAALAMYGDLPTVQPPEEAYAAVRDPSVAVRLAALDMFARRHQPAELAPVLLALQDSDLTVRLAAIAALAKFGPEAWPKLRALAQDGTERFREAAVDALHQAGDRPSVVAAATDESWRVRRVVARSLADLPAEERQSALPLAERLLADQSSVVRLSLLESLADWPLELSGPLLMAGLASNEFRTRETARQTLREHWPPASQFPVQADSTARRAALEKLAAAWQQEFGGELRLDVEKTREQWVKRAQPIVPATAEELAQLAKELRRLESSFAAERTEAEQTLRQWGPRLAPALEQLAAQPENKIPPAVMEQALLLGDPLYQAIEQLRSATLQRRREGAASLAQQAREETLPGQVLERLAQLAIAEEDPVIWMSLLEAVSADAGVAADQLARAALTHPSAEVRRRGCQHLARHLEPRHAEVLLASLQDEDPAVVRTAAEAIGHLPRLADVTPLKQLLGSPDLELRVLAAESLARLGSSSGPAALERFAWHDDPKVRHHTAVAMGKLRDPQYTSTLIRFLDDRPTVQLAALAALPQATGEEVVANAGASNQGITDRVAAWRKWHEAAKDR